jgi:hypothetical protein
MLAFVVTNLAILAILLALARLATLQSNLGGSSSATLQIGGGSISHSSHSSLHGGRHRDSASL